MDELEDRVRRAALEAVSGGAALPRRDAAREERADRRRERQEHARRAAALRSIIRKLRAALKDRGDIGTVSFRRQRRHRLGQLLAGHGRGWVVAAMPAEVLLTGEFAGARRSCELELVLLTDGRLHAAADGVVYDRYRPGQTYHPEMPVTFPMQAWRDLEDRIPETLGALVGRLQLTWQVG